MRYLSVLLLFCVVSACDSQGPDHEDFSHITEAFERWEAYELDNYTIDQQILCFCGGPHRFRLLVVADTLNDVVLDQDDLEGWEISEEEIKRYVIDRAYTVEEAFQLITDAFERADDIDVEYDPRYGFPTRINIDWIKEAADDEITILMSNLRF